MSDDDRLYFRQLLAGRDFARTDPIARQMVNFVYLIGDRQTGEAVIVDPAYGIADLLAILDACAHQRLADVEVEWDDRASVGVVMASEGYPGPTQTGRLIEGIADVDDDVQVFIAGAKRVDGRLLTSGGRVLCVVAQADTMEAAQAKAYDNVARITFEGAQYRRDIGDTAALPLKFAR